ncbi:hypothetical protein EIP86_004368 [Pleurotus ostreatoroseus]|nr:hypothetical protein EIP86_004368 [Pleurotus ostreatoroseus]
MAKKVHSRYARLQRERHELERLEREIWDAHRNAKDGEKADSTRVLQILRRKIDDEGHGELQEYYAKLQRLDRVREALAQMHATIEEDDFNITTPLDGMQLTRKRSLSDMTSARLWGVIIGVDVYNDPDTLDLSGACADARKMWEYIRGLAVPSTQISLLLSEAAPANESFGHCSSLDPVSYTIENVEVISTDNTDNIRRGIGTEESHPETKSDMSVRNPSHGSLSGIYRRFGSSRHQQLDDDLREERCTAKSTLRATRGNILNTLYDIRDNPNISRNDSIVIYFAGHGARWDLATEGQHIETLCPADRGCRDSEGRIIPDITDREFAILLEELRAAKGDHIVVIMDCCHSGGITRELPERHARARATSRIRNLTAHNILQAANHPRKKSKKDPAAVDWDWDIECCVLLAACIPSETASEVDVGGTMRGRFTSSLLAALQHDTLESFAELQKVVYDYMPQYLGFYVQNPMFLGPPDRLESAGFKPWFALRCRHEDSYELEKPGQHEPLPVRLLVCASVFLVLFAFALLWLKASHNI